MVGRSPQRPGPCVAKLGLGRRCLEDPTVHPQEDGGGAQAVEPHGALTVEAAVSRMEVPDVQPVPWPLGVSSFTDWGSSDCLHSPLVAVVPRMPIACVHHSPCSH